MASQTDTIHSATTADVDRRGSRRPLLWWAAGAGAAAGIVSLALRRRHSRWQTARKQASKLAETAAREWKPLVGIAAAGTAAIAYSRRSRTPGWQKAMTRAGRLARETEIKPWMMLAASTAISLASAYKRRGTAARRLPPADAAVEKVAAGTMRLINRAKRVSREAVKLYPQLRKALA